MDSCQSNRKTALLRYNKFKPVDYLTKRDPEIARVLIKARLRMLEVKVNFKKKYDYKLNCPFCTDDSRKDDLILIMTPEKQDKSLELSKHYSVDSTPAMK